MDAQIPRSDEPPVAARNGSRGESRGESDGDGRELDAADEAAPDAAEEPELQSPLWRDRSFVACRLPV